jgi:A/G-specific adenine glycosylase
MHEELGIEVEVTSGEALIVVKHAYTHFRITLHAFDCRLAVGSPVPQCIECDDFRWATPEEITALPMSVADRKIARILLT